MNGLILLLTLSIIVVGGCISAIPSLSPKETLFGVSIDAAFRSSAEARRALTTFRLMNLAMTAISAGAFVLLAPLGNRWLLFFPSVLVIAQFVVGTFAFAY